MSFDLDFMPEEVILDRAPLVRVLCQIRFSSSPELVEDSNERAIAAALTDLLPVRGTIEGIALPLAGLPSAIPQHETMRTFEDVDGAWKATVAPAFVALETTTYTRRSEFVERLTRVLTALEAAATPPRVTRIGMRYTDRITRPEGLTHLVNPGLLGMLPEVTSDDMIENQIQQTLLVDPKSGSKIQVRSLCLPPNVGFDPSIQPTPEPSWVLDIDAYSEDARPWLAKDLADTVETLAKRAYQVFHWAVTDDFRKAYGG